MAWIIQLRFYGEGAGRGRSPQISLSRYAFIPFDTRKKVISECLQFLICCLLRIKNNSEIWRCRLSDTSVPWGSLSGPCGGSQVYIIPPFSMVRDVLFYIQYDGMFPGSPWKPGEKILKKPTQKRSFKFWKCQKTNTGRNTHIPKCRKTDTKKLSYNFVLIQVSRFFSLDKRFSDT